MDCYTGAHVVEALVVGFVVAGIGFTVYYKKFSKWTKKLREKL